jgi:hypothetical protein
MDADQLHTFLVKAVQQGTRLIAQVSDFNNSRCSNRRPLLTKLQHHRTTNPVISLGNVIPMIRVREAMWNRLQRNSL